MNVIPRTRLVRWKGETALNVAGVTDGSRKHSQWRTKMAAETNISKGGEEPQVTSSGGNLVR